MTAMFPCLLQRYLLPVRRCIGPTLHFTSCSRLRSFPSKPIVLMHWMHGAHTFGPAQNVLIYYHGVRPTLSVEEQFFLTLLKLRQNKVNFELSCLFDITERSVTNVFVTWVNFMAVRWDEVEDIIYTALMRLSCNYVEQGDIKYVDVGRELDARDDGDYHLPSHHRCACHTLHLVATIDADRAEADTSYKKLSRATFGKCQALWNKVGRSVMSADAVWEICGMALVRSNQIAGRGGSPRPHRSWEGRGSTVCCPEYP